jgi:hypothetical protein
MIEQKKDQLAKWNLWRDEVAEYCRGNWDSMATKYCNNPAISTLLAGKINITCPECDKSQKLNVIDDNTLKSVCCSASCSKCYWDGIATIAALDGIHPTDVLKRISEGENLKKDNVLRLSNKNSQYNKPTQKPKEATPPKIKKGVAEERQLLLSQLTPVTLGDHPVTKYINNRGLNNTLVHKSIQKHLWFIDKLKYYKAILDDNEIVIDHERGNYPSLVAKVLDCNLQLVGFHKTYLDYDGNKAKVYDPKQLSRSLYKGQYSENGSVIPLCTPNNGRYGIAEGIETSLAILAMNRPCWSTLTANGIKAFIPPNDCEILDIYGDLDASGTGQKVIIELYCKLLFTRPEIKVNMYLPPEALWDFNKNPKGIDFLNAFLINKKLLPTLGGFTC